MIVDREQSFYTVKDVPAEEFIRAYASHLKKNNKIEVPQWLSYVTNGPRNELAPQDEDWVFIRVASVARKIYLRRNIGVSTLRHIYGGRQRNLGNVPERHRASAGKVIRWSMQALEKIGVVKKDKKNQLKKGSRLISKEGQTDLNRIATTVAKQLREARQQN
ncbi:hypothetical protein PPERSA_12100 [Pseudocohnilembus persalinus]|uniref:Ribosomal protein S19e n=1 Tax=Pseudocohnilembus persalinus TaxID=266149 RepID=A0A0V0R9D3_PSEPJ|nr:hypothetical protein PPERSA_12100 [Pseudocohnilembus persalinus]|eukprot:KRX10976.1 hypothetical protein PPERSA_12100 [Pseudocohnilembus persalinus]